jgi:hypothetical protein
VGSWHCRAPRRGAIAASATPAPFTSTGAASRHSSVGISVVNTLLTQNTEVNHAAIAQHVAAVSRMFEDPMIARFWNRSPPPDVPRSMR